MAEGSGEQDSAIPAGWLHVWRASVARRRHEREEVRRFTKRRRNRRRWWLVGAASLALLVGFVALALFSPLLSARQFEIVGAQRLDVAAASESLNSLAGQPLAQLTDKEVEQVLSQYVIVQSYSVQRVPPDRVIVHVVERVPVGVLTDGKGSAVVDAAGVELWRDDAAPQSLPTIEGTRPGSAAFAAIGQVLLALPDDFRATVQSIRANTPDSVELQLRDGKKVIWGSAEQVERKAEVLVALVKATGGNAKEFDVSSPDRPVTR